MRTNELNVLVPSFHRISPHFLQKFTSFLQKFTASTFLANKCEKCGESGEFGEKKFHHISPHFLQKFTAKFTAFLTTIRAVAYQRLLNLIQIHEKYQGSRRELARCNTQLKAC